MRALVAEFYPHNAVFDPVTDKLIDTSPPATPLCKAYPEPYRNPKAQAIDAYRAALAAAQPSEPVRSKPLGTLAPSQPARPGFAVK